MTAEQPSVTFQLADSRLNGRLREYVTEKRAAEMSWRRISLALRDEIGMDITFETLRKWFPDDVRVPRAVAKSA